MIDPRPGPPAPPAPAAFVATLGLQPQIITRALDQLRPLEPRLELAVILHTAEYRPHPQWPTLADFSAYLSYTYAPLRVELSLLQQPGEAPLRDVVSPADAEVAFRVIYNVTRDLKRRGYRLHSLIAGGRKSIIIYSVLSAQLLFDAQDKLWHIFSRDEYERDRFDREMGLRPHVAGDVVHLVEVPVLFVSRVAPLIRELILHSDDPTRAVRIFEEQEDAERLAYLQRFFNECDPGDRRILLLRYQGVTNAVIARQLGYSESAVSNRLRGVAERYFQDPRAGRSRYAELPPNPQVAILAELRPILSDLANT
jgi:CRISPR-associated protein (TIGR02584 family)